VDGVDDHAPDLDPGLRIDLDGLELGVLGMCKGQKAIQT